MCNYIYTGKPIAMPNSKSIEDWKDFFNDLMEMDYYAPMHTLINHCAFLYDLALEIPPTPYATLYHDIGVELSVDGEYPANEAAIESNYITKGLCQLVDAAHTSTEYSDCYIKVLSTVVSRMNHIASTLSDDMYFEAYKLVGHHYFNNHPNLNDEVAWGVVFRYALMTDPCAEASILSYYLEEVNDFEFRVFCPLDCKEYETIGAAMRNSLPVLNAAINSGLMASAIATYFGAALDVVENWNCMVHGLIYLLNSMKLRCFVPTDDQIVAERLLREFNGPTNNEDEEAHWYELKRHLREVFAPNAPRGY